MLKLKGCKKCHGDVRLERDQYGWYEQCLQCGALIDIRMSGIVPGDTELLTPVIKMPVTSRRYT